MIKKYWFFDTSYLDHTSFGLYIFLTRDPVRTVITTPIFYVEYLIDTGAIIAITSLAIRHSITTIAIAETVVLARYTYRYSIYYTENIL